MSTLEEAGLAEVRARDVRHNYEVSRPGDFRETGELAKELYQRFVEREERELSRVQELLAFAASESCQWRVLRTRFGQTLTEPCGACSSCAGVSSARHVSEPEESRDPVEVEAQVRALGRELDELAGVHPEALEEPRQKARFLAGLNSPALAKAQMTKHRRFGELAHTPFRALLSALNSDG